MINQILLQIDPALGFPREIWQTTQPTARITQVKARLLATERVIDLERARYGTESYRQTEGEPTAIRRAIICDATLNCSLWPRPASVKVDTAHRAVLDGCF